MKLTGMISKGAVLGAVLAGASFSALSVQAQEFSDEHMAAAREVVQATNGLKTFDDILPLLAEQTRTLFIQSDPSRTQEVVEVTTEVALSLAPRRAELNKTVYEVWARRFTQEELEQLAEFYQSPLGTKLAENGPTLTALAIGAARQWQDTISTEMVSLVREELDKRAQESAPAPE
ncbi:hypothetical protein JM93_01861 [Roseibium hamelinense]|uniref:DUF2059 domain-containing protein n=1 Tax=Roseibium hamelinense TaxID=150831 RepID=A0A562T7R2_9HYPH|nr:DUF2059 domain-containing protein [Roseibium hamelinense]MTI43551.1 DUF2059 domain-containing protein [Roseibium hamelinense]TWI89655.1 hypothetical protein JM93_01861 [Roseibium hamelinense]